jgi:hypothetical protein
VVAGAAALVWSSYPELTAAQVRQVLQETADKVDEENGEWADGRSKQYGFGKVNALAAMLKAAEISDGRSGAGDDDPSQFIKSLSGGPDMQSKRLRAALEPMEGSWDVRGKTITVRPSKEWVAIMAPANPARRKRVLAAVLQPDRAGSDAIHEVHKEKNKRLLLVPRSALLEERELQGVAERGSLVPLAVVYQSGDELLVPLDTLTCRLEDAGEMEKLQAFARRTMLEIVECKKEVVQLRWVGASEFATVFEAMAALHKEVRARWCEPDFVRRLHNFDRN